MQEPPTEPIYPRRVPLKVIGWSQQISEAKLTALIQEHLGPFLPDSGLDHINQKGAYSSFTYWILLPDEESERPLREAIHRMPGVIMLL